MPAYLIIQSRISDPEPMSAYREAVMPLIERYNGKHIVKGVTAETLEGTSADGRLNILEFPSLEVLRAFWNSPEYVKIKQLRHGAAEFDAWAVPGIE